MRIWDIGLHMFAYHVTSEITYALFTYGISITLQEERNRLTIGEHTTSVRRLRMHYSCMESVSHYRKRGMDWPLESIPSQFGDYVYTTYVWDQYHTTEREEWIDHWREFTFFTVLNPQFKFPFSILILLSSTISVYYFT